MTLLKKYKFDLLLTLALILIGQIVFFFMSPDFTRPTYEGRVYATTGVQHRSGDLHKLNEGAHYFGQTMLGWMKFPSFSGDIKAYANLPEDARVSSHIQERQNIIFTVNSVETMNQVQLDKTREFIQNKMDAYNEVNQTKFVLSNVDYEVRTLQKSYLFGAAVSILVAVLLGMGIGFIRRELF